MSLAKKLEDDLVIKEHVCAQICKDLDDLVSPRYIQKLLPEDYKEKRSKRTSSQVDDKKEVEESSIQEPRKVEMLTDGSVTSSASSTGPDGNEVEVEQEDRLVVQKEPVDTINEELQEKNKIIKELRNEILTIKECPPHITPQDVSNTVIAQGERIRELEEIIHSQNTGYTKASNLTEKIFTQKFPVQDSITYFFAQIRKLYPGAVMEYVVNDGNEVIDARVASYGRPR